MNISLLSLALIQSALLAMGQVMLKLGLLRMEPFGWNPTFWRAFLQN
jgi:undecaprenyl phosphate-alpha-L-ara4N flippase subunit ArnE